MVEKGEQPPAWTFKTGQRSDPTASQKNHKAGPGSYSPEIGMKHSSLKIKQPVFSMAGHLITSKGTYEQSPGVGSYSIGGNLLGASPGKGKSFGTKTNAQNYYPPAHGPGPGAYGGVSSFGAGSGSQSKSALGNKQVSASHSMGSILPDVAFKQANISPGPAAYGSPAFRSSIDGKRFSVNKGDRFGSEPRGNDKHLNDMRKNPGIGSYSLPGDIGHKSKHWIKSSPSYGFGSAPRPAPGGSVSPGPGAYKIPVHVAQTSNYDGIQQTLPHKYV